MAEVDADILDGVQEKLRKVATGHSYALLSSQEAQTLLNELARLRGKVRSVADWLRYHANSEGGFIAELLDHAPYDSPPSAPVTDDPTPVEIAAERDAARARAAAAESRSAAESEHLFGAGKAFERAQVVAYMRANWENWPAPGRPARDFTAEIERGEHIAEIAAERDAAERDAAEQRASEQRQRAKEAEDACVSLRSRVAELERERAAVRATHRSELAQAFAAAMLAEHREDNLPWDEVMRRAFDAADAFLATEKETP